MVTEWKVLTELKPQPIKPAGFTCPSASKLTDACQARLKILKEVFECLSPMALIVNYKYL